MKLPKKQKTYKKNPKNIQKNTKKIYLIKNVKKNKMLPSLLFISNLYNY